MNTKSWTALWRLCVCLCLLAGLSCSEEEKEEQVYPLTFEKGEYQARLNLTESIPVIGGSKSYTLQVENPAVLEAEVAFPSTIGFGEIRLKPKAKGRTALLVTDRVSGDTKKLSVEVTDFYMGFSIAQSSHPSFPEGEALYLVANESKTCYLLKASDDEVPVIEVDKEGDYQFSAPGNSPSLTVNFHDPASGQTQTFAFDVSDTKKDVLNVLNGWFALGWESLQFRSISSPSTTFLILKDDRNTIRCRILSAELPHELLR